MPTTDRQIAAANAERETAEATRIVSRCGRDCRTCERADVCPAFMIDFARVTEGARQGR